MVDWDTWISETYLGGNYQGTVVGVDASSLTARALLERFTSDADDNFIHFYHEDYDTAFNQAVASTDEQEQIAFYKECQTILTNEAANVYLQDMAELVALNNKYAGYEFYPLYVLDVSKLYEVTE